MIFFIKHFFKLRMGNESVDSGLSAACAIAVLAVTPVGLVALNILQTFSLGAIFSLTIWAKGKDFIQLKHSSINHCNQSFS